MNGNHATNKQTGSELTAQEWNALAADVNELGQNSGSGGGSGTPSTVIDTSGIISVSSKGNVTVGSNKNVNIEPAWDNNTANYSGNYGDVAIKSGDDIQFCSHHREPKKRDKIVIKNIDGSDNPVKLQVVAGEIDLAVGTENNPKTATKKKDATTGADLQTTLFKSDDAKVMDVRILTGTTLDKNTANEREERGYLKVRAQAIDLRCEKHGGIALQPKGFDSDGNMNKIKFEHGGGDGLEFGTFNTEKTSIFTNEYRFNKDGIWKMARRETESSGKTIIDEGTIPAGKGATGLEKYKKNNSLNQKVGCEPADDFYDFIDVSDEQCTTKDIIKTAYALNNYPGVHTKITNKGALEIGTSLVYKLQGIDELPSGATAYPVVEQGIIGGTSLRLMSDKYYSVSDINERIKFYPVGTDLSQVDGNTVQAEVTLDGSATIYINFGSIAGAISGYCKLEPQPIPSIKIDSGAELKLGGILDFGSSFNFGETDNGIEVQYKLTKKNATKDCGVLKVVGVNNHATNNLTVEGVTIAPGQTGVIAQCSLLDMIKLVNYMKTNNQGPWSA